MKRIFALLIFSILSISATVSFAQPQYDHARLLVWQDTLFGLIDGTGKTVLPCEYEDITTYSKNVYHQDYIVAKRNGLWGVLIWDGTALLPFKYDVEPIPIPNSEGLFLLSYEDKPSGVINSHDAIVIPFQYRDLAFDELSEYFTDIPPRLTYTTHSGRSGCINEYGRNINLPEYKNIDFTEKLIIVTDTLGRQGLMDYDGHWLREPDSQYTYDIIWYDFNVTITERRTHLQGLVGNDGQIVLPIRYQEIQPMYPNVVRLQNTSGLYALADAQFHELTPYRYKELFNLCDMNYTNWFMGILPDSSAEILDTLGHVLQTNPPLYFEKDNPPYEFPLVEVDGAWQLVGPNGKLLPKRYSAASHYWSESLFSVAVDSLHWGIVDRKGRVIVPMRYTSADANDDDIIFARRTSGEVDVFNGKGRKLLTCWGALEDGRMLVVANSEGKWALADPKTGRVVSLYYNNLEPIYFSDRTGFSNCWEAYDENGNLGYLDGQGREIFPCSLDNTKVYKLPDSPLYKYFDHDCDCGENIYYFIKKDADERR